MCKQEGVHAGVAEATKDFIYPPRRPDPTPLEEVLAHVPSTVEGFRVHGLHGRLLGGPEAWARGGAGECGGRGREERLKENMIW